MNKLEQKREIVRGRVATTLGNSVICDRCGATYLTMNDTCTAELLDRCPGFNRIDEVQMPIEREVFQLQGRPMTDTPHKTAEPRQEEIEAAIGQELRLWSVEQRRQTVKADPAGNDYDEWWVVLRDRAEHSRHDDKLEASEEMYAALAHAIAALSPRPAPELAGEIIEAAAKLLHEFERQLPNARRSPSWEHQSPEFHAHMLNKIRAILPALSSRPAPALPAGWQLVPKEPTIEMIEVALIMSTGHLSLEGSILDKRYRAMLVAAPSPPELHGCGVGEEIARGAMSEQHDNKKEALG